MKSKIWLPQKAYPYDALISRWLNYDKFTSWASGVTEREIESETLFYNQCLHPEGHAWTRGTQRLPINDSHRGFVSINDSEDQHPNHGTGRGYASCSTLRQVEWQNRRSICSSRMRYQLLCSQKQLANVRSLTGFFPSRCSIQIQAGPEISTRANEAARVFTCIGVASRTERGMTLMKLVKCMPRYVIDETFLTENKCIGSSFNEEPKGTISIRAYEHEFQGQRVVSHYCRRSPYCVDSANVQG